MNKLKRLRLRIRWALAKYSDLPSIEESKNSALESETELYWSLVADLRRCKERSWLSITDAEVQQRKALEYAIKQSEAIISALSDVPMFQSAGSLQNTRGINKDD